MEVEIWKPVVGYEGLYDVSNLGNVRSLPKTWLASFGSKRSHNGIVLKPVISCGYFKVGLFKNKNREIKPIHVLVAESFLDYVKVKNGTLSTNPSRIDLQYDLRIRILIAIKDSKFQNPMRNIEILSIINDSFLTENIIRKQLRKLESLGLIKRCMFNSYPGSNLKHPAWYLNSKVTLTELEQILKEERDDTSK